ncbi:hypothetical protein K440DRAFT_33046 [Wilcoxina mikolae CBS 423.85]|nr:hypothetical protein K440DRAFT_33046 [Wilcoxina mikolae CBS 423.85]
MHPSEEDEPAPPPSSAQLPLKISVYQLEIPSSATTMATGKAQEQILKFHQLQNEQLEVLKALFNVESIEPPQSDVDDSSGESSTEAVVDTPGEEADNPFPPTWDIAWDNNALAQRRDEILQRLRILRPEDDPASSDNVTSFIAKTILKDIDQLHFNRIPDPETSTILPSHKRVNLAEWSDDEAFHVRDFDQNRMIAASRARDGIERDCGGGVNFLEHLKKPRSEAGARGREIDIQAITPSALATVFMCEGLNAT